MNKLVTKSRPVNLNLFKFKFPVTAIASGLHRFSGLIIFLLIPLLLWLLQASLYHADFHVVQQAFAQPWLRLIVWIMLSSLIYHTIAGIRHILMDLGWFESLHAGRKGAYLVMILSAVLIILAGVWLW